MSAGTYHVYVSNRLWPSPPEQTTSVPPSQVLNFTFPQRYTISGKVLDLTAHRSGASSPTNSHDPMDAYTQTDATGTYTLTVKAGTYHIRVSKSAFAQPAGTNHLRAADQVVNFTFSRRYTIRGTVRNYDDTPVEGALCLDRLGCSDPRQCPD